MNKLTRIAAPLIAVAMMTSVPMTSLAQSNTPQTQNNAAQDWNTPPAGTEQAQAYHDGIEAAKLDALAHRKIDAKSSYLYVHPPVKKDARDAYHQSFEAGYNAAVQHGAAS